MTHAQQATSKNVRVSRQDGTTITSTTVDTTVTEDLPQEANAVSTTVDFGTDSDMATTTVTGQGWVRSTSRLSASFAGTTADHDVEDALLEGLVVVVSNIVEYVGFDVTAHAPDSTFGLFNVHVIGV